MGPAFRQAKVEAKYNRVVRDQKGTSYIVEILRS